MTNSSHPPGGFSSLDRRHGVTVSKRDRPPQSQIFLKLYGQLQTFFVDLSERRVAPSNFAFFLISALTHKLLVPPQCRPIPSELSVRSAKWIESTLLFDTGNPAIH
jgi:hypothetical protein